MADSNRTRGSIAGDCEGEGGERGERGKRGKRGPRGHRGPPGPAAANKPPFWPAEVARTIFIYARPGGDDEHGNGSLERPYATFSRAIRDVPMTIVPLERYVVDITGVQELLPPDYAVPPIKSWGYYGVWVDDLDTRVFSNPLTIRAQYVPLSSVPEADRTISAAEVTGVVNDPVTGLLTISTTKSYPENALAGAIMQTGSSPKRTTMVYGNTAGPNSVITLANTSGNAAWFAGPFQLLEQSATLTAQNGNETYTGISFRHIDSFFVDGIKFRNADPDQYSYSVNCIQSSTPIFGACDIEGIYIGPGTAYFYPNATMFRNKVIESESQTDIAFGGCVLQDMPTIYTYDVERMSLFGCGVRNCAALGARPAVLFTPAFTTVGTGFSTKLVVAGVQIDGSVADTDFGTPGYGIFVNATATSIANCKINDCAADAIYCTSNSSASIQSVAGDGNVGVGIRADMGSQVSVDAATTVSGTVDDVQSGSLGPVSYAALDAQQQYDLPPWGASLADATGARIFRV